MKVIMLLCIVLVLCSTAQAQTLANTKWIRVSKSYSDGTPAMGRFETENTTLIYHFTDGGVASVISDHDLYYEVPYCLTNDKLNVGQFLQYTVEKIANDTLVLREETEANSALITSVFVRCATYYNILIEEGSVEMIGDSIIVCDKRLSPVCKKSMPEAFRNEFNYGANRRLYGYAILQSDGTVSRVEEVEAIGLSKKQKSRLIAIMQKTSGLWVMPEINRPVKFQVKFLFETAHAFLGPGFSMKTSFAFHKTPEQKN